VITTSDGRKPNVVLVVVLTTLLAGVLGLPADAAVIWDGNDDGDNPVDNNWSTGDNWDTGAEPSAGEVTTIDNGDLALVNQSGEVAKKLILGGASTVRQTGGDLTLDTPYNELSGEVMFIGGDAAYELLGGSLQNDGLTGDVIIETGSFVQTGGTFMSPSTSSSGTDDFYVGNATSGSGLLRIAGGSFYTKWSNARLGIAHQDNGADGRMEVSGSGIGAIEVGDDFELGSRATLEFELDAGGVTPVSVAAAGSPHSPVVSLGTPNGDARLAIELLEPAPETDIELIDFQDTSAITGTFDGLAEGDQVEAGFGLTRYFWNITYQGDDGNDVVLEFDRTVIPEPASPMLLALGCLALLGRRRPRGKLPR
jgi:hypothetical protein